MNHVRTAPRGIRAGRARVALLAALLLGVVAFLPACTLFAPRATTNGPAATATHTSGGSTSASPTATATAAAAATLPPLTPQQGWQTVLSLAQSGTSTQSVDSFTASAPYVIMHACTGSGSFQITYGTPRGNITETATCSGPPTPHGTQQWTPSPPGQQVEVNAMGQGDVSWEVLVEMQG